MTFPVYSLRQAASWAIGRSWPLRSLLTSRRTKRRAAEYLSARQKDLFFVLGTGRSGTQLIADLMNASGHAAVFHEPNFRSDVATMEEHRRNPDRAAEYWREFRSVEVYRRWLADRDARFYGEVTGTLRYHAPVIRSLFPSAQLFLISRDGRGFVRSVMGWPFVYGRGSVGVYALAPLEDDPYFAEWPRMDRFERICWAWQETNAFLMRHVDASRWLQFEALVADYGYFSERLTGRLGLDFPRELWKEHAERKSRNSTKEYGFPDWDGWSKDQQDAFRRICGDTMAKLGYRF